MAPMILDVDPPIWHDTYPFESTRYATSDDESVMAIIIDENCPTVQLIRTSDLKVLLAQRILYSSSSSSSSSDTSRIELCFIKKSPELKSSRADILVIFVYETSDDVSNDVNNIKQDHHQHTHAQGQLIIISGIDGGLLNSLDRNTFARASSALKVSTFDITNFPLFAKQSIVTLGGCFLNDNIIRILIAFSPGVVIAYDYNVSSYQLSSDRPRTLDLSSLSVSDSRQMKHIQGYPLDFTFHKHFALVNLAIECNDGWDILWCDMKYLKVVGKYSIEKKREMSTLRILSCISVKSINQECIAAVVAFKGDEGPCFLEIIQSINIESISSIDIELSSPGDKNPLSVVEPVPWNLASKKTTSNGASPMIDSRKDFVSGLISCTSLDDILAISNFHRVFRVPLVLSDDQSSTNVSCVQLKRSSIDDPFRFQYWFIQNSTSYFKEFIPGDDAIIGKFRLLLALKSYDDAETLIEERGSLQSSFGSMHISEVALHNFKSLLQVGNLISKQSIEKAKYLLRQLAHGAVAGGHIGVESLISASVALYNLPDDNISIIQSNLLTIKEYRRALVAISSAFRSALQGVSRSFSKQLEDQKKVIDQKIDALDCLDMFPEIHQDNVDCSWIMIKSPKELFQTLISQGHVSAALRLKDLDCCRSLIDTEAMVMAIIQIKATINPEIYTHWLTDVLLHLNPGDTQVSTILNWVHRMADELDEDNKPGIDSSLLLLGNVKATLIKMFGGVHKSYASILGRGIATASTVSDLAVMRVNFIRGYGNKAIDSLVSRRLRHFNSEGQDEDMDDENCISLVETKLLNAQALKEARLLGLSAEDFKMKDFSMKTNSALFKKCNITLARSLLLHFFNKAEFDLIKTNVQPYCEKFHVDFDHVIMVCVDYLCERKAIKTIPDIVVLAQMTKSPDITCDLALQLCRLASLSDDEVPNCVFAFANDAMSETLSDSMRSELNEAIRLLIINDIIRRYCGLSAREFFNLSDIRHASRLLDFVCTHVSSSDVLTDALALCNAFTHLSKIDTCVVILQRTISFAINQYPFYQSDANHIEHLVCLHRQALGMEQHEFHSNRARSLDYAMQKVYSYHAQFPPSITSRVCRFCAELLDELKRGLHKASPQSKNTTRLKTLMKLVCSSATGILTNALESPNIVRDALKSSYDTLLRSFRNLEKLQRDYDLFITLNELNSKQLAQSLVEEIFLKNTNFEQTGSRRSSIFKAKQFCHLFFTSFQESAITFFSFAGEYAAKTVVRDDVDPFLLYIFIEECGRDITKESTAPILIHFAMSLCRSAVFDIIKCIKMGSVDSVMISLPHSSRETIKNGHASPCTNEKNIVSETYQREVLKAIRKCVCAFHIFKESPVLRCSTHVLPITMQSLGTLDIITSVFQKFDSRIGEISSSYHHFIMKELLSGCTGAYSDKGYELSSCIPVLKPSWYADDGLLIPPLDGLKCSFEFLGFNLPSLVMKSRCQLLDVDKLARLLFSRGALSLTYRLLSFMSALITVQPSSFHSGNEISHRSDELIQQVIQRLAERSLGTAGGGLISGDIDSQLAVAYILILPPTIALKVLSSSLPSSISRRDFVRLIKLTAVGLRACGKDSIYDDEDRIDTFLNNRWGKDLSFIQRAQELSKKAQWWSILQRLDLDFDPQTITKPGLFCSIPVSVDQRSCNVYSDTLCSFVESAFRSIKRPSTVYCLLNDFSRQFAVEVTSLIEISIKYLLSIPSSPSGKRMDMRACEMAVKQLLDLVPACDQRTSILRSCLIAHELRTEATHDSLNTSTKSTKHDSLDTSTKSTESVHSVTETDYECCHLILSIYSVELTKTLSQYDNHDSPPSDVLDELVKVRQRKDTLQILASYFQGDKLQHRPMVHRFFRPLWTNDQTVTTDNTESSILLGTTESNCPNIFDSLMQIGTYLRETQDYSAVSALAPICIPLSLPSGFIHARSLVERMKRAREVSSKPLPFKTDIEPVINRLKSAKDASLLAEWCSTYYPENSIERLECLELAETLAFNAAKDLEFDANVDSALERYRRMRCEKSTLSDSLSVQKLLTKPNCGCSNFTPATSILGMVNENAHRLYEESKLIPPEALAENLLVSGAESVAKASLSDTGIFTPNDFRLVASLVHKACAFLQKNHSHLDLGSICKKLSTQWITHADNETKNELGIKRLYESREESEFKDISIGLRVAFVLSFCESFHQKNKIEDITNKESHRDVSVMAIENRNRFRLGKHKDSASRESELAMNHARFLLNITFEKNTGLFSNDVLTFAMRHRALRAARVLCPEDVLLIIMHQDLGLSVEGVEMRLLLRKCCFGCFVAKEVESMGLNLPSSDLITLSFMDYVSFARVLWRQNGRVDQGYRSRFLLLLLDLARSDDTAIDTEFITILQRELDSMKVKRY